MSKVRMQGRYWEMIHEAIAFFIKKEELELNKMMSKKERYSGNNDRELNDINNKIASIRDDIERYKAIDQLVLSAASKPDGIFESNKGIGPDYIPHNEPEFEEETPEDEFKWRTNDSIGY